MRIGNIEFDENKYGMLRQRNPGVFDYSMSYLESQSTNLEMSYLRLGYLSSIVSYGWLRNCTAVELGPGSGVFFDIMCNHVKRMEGYDVRQSDYLTITQEELHNTSWDLLCAFDVLEHFPDIDDLWKIDFEVGYFSIPSPPDKGITPQWRHWKPDEHIWHITAEQFAEWVEDHGYRLLAVGCPEDLLRKRWDEEQVNINSFVITR